MAMIVRFCHYHLQTYLQMFWNRSKGGVGSCFKTISLGTKLYFEPSSRGKGVRNTSRVLQRWGDLVILELPWLCFFRLWLKSTVNTWLFPFVLHSGSQPPLNQPHPFHAFEPGTNELRMDSVVASISSKTTISHTPHPSSTSPSKTNPGLSWESPKHGVKINWTFCREAEGVIKTCLSKIVMVLILKVSLTYRKY